MVAITIVLDEQDVLQSCRAEGHAEAGPSGGDIVCAAVSVLLRTFLRVTESKEGITVRADTANKGFVCFEAAGQGQGRDFLQAAGAFLLEGLQSVAEEYPKNCKIVIRRKKNGA